MYRYLIKYLLWIVFSAGTYSTSWASADNDHLLNEAVSESDYPYVVRLIEAGHDVNAFDEFGVSSLQIAVLNDDDEIVHLLLMAGADPNRARGLDRTPRVLAKLFRRRAILEAFANASHLQNLGRFGEGPLHHALVEHNFEGALRLLLRGANFYAPSTSGRTPEEITNLLIENHGSDAVRSDADKILLWVATIRENLPRMPFAHSNSILLP